MSKFTIYCIGCYVFIMGMIAFIIQSCYPVFNFFLLLVWLIIGPILAFFIVAALFLFVEYLATGGHIDWEENKSNTNQQSENQLLSRVNSTVEGEQK